MEESLPELHERWSPPARKRGTRGSEIVEFGIVMLPLLGFVFLLLDVGWMLFGWACIQEAAREGVRYAVTESGTTAQSLCTSVLSNAVIPYSFGFVNTTNAPNCSGSPSVVKIDYYPSSGYSASGTPTALTSNQTAVGNVVKITISGVSISSFGPFYRTKAPVYLTATAADVLQ